MAVLAGIDEAGFGPLLGPLVVSSAVFSLPKEILEKDMWAVLRKSVGDRRRHLAGRVLIADSKKAHNKKDGIKHLQRTAMAFLKHSYSEPANLTELLGVLCPDCLERIAEYPWYKEVGEYGLSYDAKDIAIASQVLKDDLASNDIELLAMQSKCLDVAYYNRLMETVKNKATVLFTATTQLIANMFERFGGDDLHIIIDRQGGRSRYGRNLLRMFPGAELVILKETPRLSSYELKLGKKKMRLHFVVGADDKFLPVSLASMVSKFLRELLVDNINRHFAGFNSELRPTAGYWKDGTRFVQDLKTSANITFDSNQLIRCR